MLKVGLVLLLALGSAISNTPGVSASSSESVEMLRRVVKRAGARAGAPEVGGSGGGAWNASKSHRKLTDARCTPVEWESPTKKPMGITTGLKLSAGIRMGLTESSDLASNVNIARAPTKAAEKMAAKAAKRAAEKLGKTAARVGVKAVKSIAKGIPMVGAIVGGIIDIFTDTSGEQFQELQESTACIENKLDSLTAKVAEMEVRLVNQIDGVRNYAKAVRARGNAQAARNALLHLHRVFTDMSVLQANLKGDIALAALCSGHLLSDPNLAQAMKAELGKLASHMCTCDSFMSFYNVVKSSFTEQMNEFDAVAYNLEKTIRLVSTDLAHPMLWPLARTLLDEFIAFITAFDGFTDMMNDWRKSNKMVTEQAWWADNCATDTYDPQSTSAPTAIAGRCHSSRVCVADSVFATMLQSVVDRVLPAARKIAKALDETSGHSPFLPNDDRKGPSGECCDYPSCNLPGGKCISGQEGHLESCDHCCYRCTQKSLYHGTRGNCVGWREPQNRLDGRKEQTDLPVQCGGGGALFTYPDPLGGWSAKILRAVASLDGLVKQIAQPGTSAAPTWYEKDIQCGQRYSSTTRGKQNVAGNAAPDVVYKFTIASSKARVTFDGCSASAPSSSDHTDQYMRLYRAPSGTKGDLVSGNQLYSADDSGCRFNNRQSKIVTSALPAGSYFFVMDGYSTHSGDFSFLVTC